MVKLFDPNGKLITSWSEWTRPKKDVHWKAARSSMELAKSWFRKGIAQPPEELLTLLSSSSRTHGARFVTGVPELVTSLPECGEGRNHDLALRLFHVSCGFGHVFLSQSIPSESGIRVD